MDSNSNYKEFTDGIHQVLESLCSIKADIHNHHMLRDLDNSIENFSDWRDSILEFKEIIETRYDCLKSDVQNHLPASYITEVIDKLEIIRELLNETKIKLVELKNSDLNTSNCQTEVNSPIEDAQSEIRWCIDTLKRIDENLISIEYATDLAK